MFSKIKNMFAPAQSSSNTPQMPNQHPKVDGADAAECPFIKNKKEQSGNADKCPVSGKGQEKK